MPDISGNPRHLSIAASSALTVVTDFERDLQMKSLCVQCPGPDYRYGTKPDLAVAECRDTIIFAVRFQLHDLDFRPCFVPNRGGLQTGLGRHHGR